MVPVRGLGARLLLALAVDRGSAVPDLDLLERLWSTEPPNQAIASVRNQVAKLRRLLGADVVERTSRGYRLNPDACRLDVDELACTLTTARALGPEPAATLIDRALGRVRGRPFDDVADEVWAMPAAAAAAELVANAEELWADAVMAAGRAGDDIARLRRAARAHPHRELRWRQLVTALAGAGRRTEGLRAVGEARRALAEFGLLPGADLLELERSLVGASDEVGIVARIPVRRDPMVGRELELAALLQRVPIVWIDGEPGSGKTRLLAELADRHAGGRNALLYATCPHILGSGIGVLSSLVTAVIEVSTELDVPADSLERWRDDDANDPVARRASLVDALVSWLEAAASRRPITAVIDDAHWLDDDTIAVLLDVIGRTRDVIRWVVASRAIDRHPPAARMRDELERVAPVYSVSLGALTIGDVHDLIDVLAPGLDAGERDALAAEVMSSTGGHPLSVAEMIGHRQRLPEGVPPRLDAIVSDSVRSLTPAGCDLVQLLAVAGGPCPVVVLSATCELDPSSLLELAERLEGEGLLAPVSVTSLDLRHDLIRRSIAKRLSPAVQLNLRRRLVRELAHDERFVIAAADQLVRCGDLLEDELVERRDRTVADAIERLLAQAEYAAARGLAERYLAVADGSGDSAPGREAILRSGMALIANGDAANGRARLLGLIDSARASDDHVVLADAILAMGPLKLGARERDGVIRDAERMVDVLPESEAQRRVQLACWAAHHRVNRGEGVAARYLLRRAEEASVTTPVLNGLILAVRAQASTLIGGGPGPTRRSLDELRAFVRSSGDVSAEAALLLLSSRQAWVDGTVADVAGIRDAIARIATRMPRPDFQWWPLALDAAIALATGSDEASAAIERAGRTGRQLGVEVAGSTELAQQLLLLFLSGDWTAAAASLEVLATAEDAPSLLAAFGLACAEAGRRDVVGDIAARLAADPQLLVRAGMTWPQVAMGASAVAFAARDTALAEFLWRTLEAYSGTGLALPGAGYFGTVDRCLGLLAATLDDRQRAVELLTSACAQEERRGATLWQTKTTADLSRVRAARGVRAAG
jgi:DNA-binding SARP family transcriptional activator